MMFKCHKSKEEKRREREQEKERLMSWRRKFAFLPKRVSETDCVWLGFYEERVVNLMQQGDLVHFAIIVDLFHLLYPKTVELGINYPAVERRKVR